MLLFECGSGINHIGADLSPVSFSAGDLFVINPFEIHDGSYTRDTPELRHLVIDFPVTLLENTHAHDATKLSSGLLSQTQRIINRISPSDLAYRDLREAYLGMYDALAGNRTDELTFFGEMYRFFGILQQAGHIRTATEQFQFDSMDFVKSVLSYIELHFAEPISTRDVSVELGYSKEHFCRLFKTSFAVTFIEYLTQYRIEKAKYFLAERSSLEVAELCGFSSQSNFSRAFRESVGISPSEYKKFILSSQQV